MLDVAAILFGDGCTIVTLGHSMWVKWDTALLLRAVGCLSQ